MKTILLIISLLLLGGESLAQSKPVPRFEDFPILRISNGKPVEVNVSQPRKARRYRTMLRLGEQQGINFAGHYIIAIWGCGAACAEYGIIDANNGKVYFPPILSHVDMSSWYEEDAGLQFRKDSKLLIAYGSPNEIQVKGKEIYGAFYYLWKNNKLLLIRSDIKFAR